MLKRSGNSGNPCLVPDFSGIVSGFSPFGVMLAVSFSCIAFIVMRCVPSGPTFSRTHIMKVMLDFVIGFFLHLLR